MSCYCETCGRSFDPHGIARHRAMHRDRCESCTIVYSGGGTVTHDYSNWKPYISTKQLPDATWCAKAVRGTKAIWGYGVTEREAIENLKEDPSYMEAGE